MKVPVLTVDKPNGNHRVYPREVINRMIENARDRIHEDRLFVVENQPRSTVTNVNDIIGVVKDIEIENDKVMVSVSFLPSHFSTTKRLEEGKIHLRTSGIGTINEQPDGTYKVADDYELISCFLTDDPA
jgi:hypothetical protein